MVQEIQSYGSILVIVDERDLDSRLYQQQLIKEIAEWKWMLLMPFGLARW